MTKDIKIRNPKLIGHIGVDSGQVIITDPCYLKNFDSDDGEFAPDASDRQTPEHADYSYAGACNVTLAKPQAGIIGVGRDGAVCSSGFGDGAYPVYVEYSDEGEWGTRVKSMTIVFIDDEGGS